jgi:hypothetical protein
VSKLWLLEPREMDEKNDPWSPWYDKAFGFVVRAKTEAEAREFAHQSAAYENKEIVDVSPWLDPDYSSCVPLTHKGDNGVILADYRAG